MTPPRKTDKPTSLIAEDDPITELKQVEEALKASEAKYRHLVKYSPTGIYEVDYVSKRLKSANDVMCKALGYTEEEFLSMDPLDLLDDDGKRTFLERIMKSLAGEKVDETVEYGIIAKDGRRFWTVLNNAFIYEEGRVTGSLVVAYDITERKRAEEALRESERRAKRASDVNRTMADLGRIIGSTLRIEEVYEQFAAVVKRIISFDRIMIGLIHDQQQTWTVAYVSGIMIEGRQVGDVLPLTGFSWDLFRKRSVTLLHLKSEEELAERYPLLLPTFRAGTRSILAAPLISKDQVIGIIQFSSLTPRAYTEEDLILAGNVAGQISGAIANAQLFAKYERSEEALRRSRDELELRVQERTAELARKNEELQNFTFAASHDLQEPLRKIQTLSDYIATKHFDSVSEQGRDYLKRMHETATRMRDVLQSLLDYSRLTRTTNPFGRVDLNKIAREAVSDFELLIQETGASVEIENLPEIEGDAGQMRQLFQNLIGNGLKFRREGIQPLVKIYAACSSSKGEWEICISDNGIGFEEKYLDLIFKPFQRLHGKNEFDGTGMGLAICAKVIEHHKGSITARSVLGEGSTFIVTLPVAGTKAMNKRG